MLRSKKPAIFRVFVLCGFFLLLGIPGNLVRAQEETVEEELPDLKELVAELNTEYKDKRDRDVERIAAIYSILEENYSKYPDADQKKIVKSIKAGFDIKPPLADRSFQKTGAASLSGMGKEGLKALEYALKSKNLKPKNNDDQREVDECIQVKAFIIEAMGMSKNPDAIKTLTKLLWDDDAETIKASCKALANYNELPLKERKEIVEELVKVYANLNTLALNNPKIPQYKQKLITVEGYFNVALNKLTLQSLESAEEWQKWYNDNKKKKEW